MKTTKLIKDKTVKDILVDLLEDEVAVDQFLAAVQAEVGKHTLSEFRIIAEKEFEKYFAGKAQSEKMMFVAVIAIIII